MCLPKIRSFAQRQAEKAQEIVWFEHGPASLVKCKQTVTQNNLPNQFTLNKFKRFFALLVGRTEIDE